MTTIQHALHSLSFSFTITFAFNTNKIKVKIHCNVNNNCLTSKVITNDINSPMLVFLACWCVVTLANTRLGLAEDGADATKYVGVLTNIYIVNLLVWTINCTKFTVCI